MNKTIYSSNLILRFYINDGWTKEELDKFCTKGEVHCFHPYDKHPYFTLDHRKGSAFDAVKLSAASKLVRSFDDYPNITDVKFIERHNW